MADEISTAPAVDRKSAHAERARVYRKENLDACRERSRAYKAANREAIKKYAKAYDAEYAVKNKDKVKARQRRWYLANRERLIAKAAERTKEKYHADIEAGRARGRENARARLLGEKADEIRAKRRVYETKRRRENVAVALRGRVATMIRSALSRNGDGKGGRTWRKMVPYTVDQLRAHLQGTMPAGYDWSDFLAGRLHIDHIVPVTAHNFTCPQDVDFQRCWALSNLRLLPRFENQSKGAKLLAPFQPSLALAVSRGAAV